MTLPITITKTEQVDIELPVPIFFRDKKESHYVGLLDEKTVVEFFIWDDSVSISNKHIDAVFAKKTIQDAAANLCGCVESEFMEAFDRAWQQMRLRPELEVCDILGSLSAISEKRKEAL